MSPAGAATPMGCTGARIRERRAERGMRQADLARACGISPSYLNLIEHDRRRIGGALLLEIARVLGTDPATLAHGAGAALLAELREAAEAAPEPRGAPAPETHRAEELALRFPGWAALLAEQARRLRRLESAVGALSDRLSHDPRLADALHEVLSAATAIRSAAAILTDPGGVDPPWQRRFLRNIAEDSLRLAQGAEALAGSLGEAEAEGAPGGGGTPREEMEAWLAAHPELPRLVAAGAGTAAGTGAETRAGTGAGMGATAERGERARPGGTVLALAAGGRAPREALPEPPASPSARALTLAWIERLGEDLRRLPEPALDAALGGQRRPDLARVARALGLPLSLVLRRMAARAGPGAPPAGLVLCDASGAPLLRRPVAGFALPRLGTPCPLWPLYDALTAPGRPVRVLCETPEPAPERHEVWAVAEVEHPEGIDGPARAEAVMLVLPAEDAGSGPARGIGPGCRICPREGCPARREPPLAGLGAAAAPSPEAARGRPLPRPEPRSGAPRRDAPRGLPRGL